MGITCECRGFRGAYARLNHPLQYLSISKLDLVRGVITVGRADWAGVFRGGPARILEMAGLTLQVYAYISKVTNIISTELYTSSLYRDLESSERSAATYRLAMGIAKIVAEKKLQVPWMQHVDPLVKKGVVTLVKGCSQRGDIVGQDPSGNWHVIEAKGRLRRPDSGTIQTAKGQAARITAINGIPPSTTSACLSNLGSRPISVLLDDPDEVPPDQVPTEFEVDETAFYQEYYSMVDVLLNPDLMKVEEIPVGNRLFYMCIPLVDDNIWFGIHSSLFRSLKREYSWEALSSFLLQELKPTIKEYNEAKYSLGLDGYAVISNSELPKLPDEF